MRKVVAVDRIIRKRISIDGTVSALIKKLHRLRAKARQTPGFHGEVTIELAEHLVQTDEMKCGGRSSGYLTVVELRYHVKTANRK